MSTLTAPFGSGLDALRGTLQRQPRSAARLQASPAADTGWLTRLAAWSDKQAPRHHRVGSYTALQFLR